MQAVILAAGNGNRLKPFTLSRSKAMAPVVGKPIISRVMEGIYAAGIKDFVVVIGPNDSPLKEYFSFPLFIENYPDISLSFATQNERLGTAHALSCAKGLISDTFILSACDSLYKDNLITDFVSAFKAQGQKGALLLQEVDETRFSKSGIVGFDSKGFINKIIEKPSPDEAPSHMASLPLYIFSPEIMEFVDKVPLSKRGEYELQDAIQFFIDKFGSLGKFVTDFRLELTSPEDLLNLNLKFLETIGFESKFPKNISSTCKIISPVYISEKAFIGNNCEIGPNVYLEEGSVIEDDCHLDNSIVLSNGLVKRGSNLSHEIVL